MCSSSLKQSADSVFALQSLNLGGKRFVVLDARAAAFERLLEYDKAMKDCRDCIVLDPKSNKSYLRASRICETRQQPEKAAKFLEHAIRFTPASQVDPYVKRLAVLQELVDCLQPQVTRIDPITMLPEELMATIFELAIDEDPKMAVRFSCVSRTWREMTINCPFLWRRVSLNGSKLSQTLKRLQIYGQRGQGKLDHIQINRLAARSEPLVAAIRPFMRRVKSLSIHSDDVESLSDFIKQLRHTCHHLEELVVESKQLPASSSRFPSQLHLGLIHPVAASALRSVRLFGIVCGGANLNDIVEETFDRMETAVFHHCWILHDELEDPNSDGPVRSDIVHRSLRQAKNLKRFEVRMPRLGTGMTTDSSDDTVPLDKLEALILPPPNEWAVNIIAPNLKRLGILRETTTRLPTFRGLLPSLKQLVPTQISVPDLEMLEITVNDDDKSAALKSWLMRLDKVVELAVISQTDCREDGGSWGTDVHLVQPMLEAANNKIVSVLHGRQEWCPRMESLRLERCLVPAREIMEYVKARRTSPALATIRDLTLDHCSTLPPEAEMWLQRNVENFKVTKVKPTTAAWRDRFR